MKVCCCSLPPSCCKNCSNNINYDFDYEVLLKNQERLGRDFEVVLYENIWDILVFTDSSGGSDDA